MLETFVQISYLVIIGLFPFLIIATYLRASSKKGKAVAITCTSKDVLHFPAGDLAPRTLLYAGYYFLLKHDDSPVSARRNDGDRLTYSLSQFCSDFASVPFISLITIFIYAVE